MSNEQQVTITIQKVWTKEGSSDYGDYIRYDVQPAEDANARYVTFKDDLGKKALELEGRKVLLTFEPPEKDGQRPKMTHLSDPLDDTVAATAPVAGSGAYVKGKEAPETQRSISASIALREAVVTVGPVGAATEAGVASVLAVADPYFDWLMDKAVVPVPTVAETEPATEGQIAEVNEMLVALEKNFPMDSPEGWTWVKQAQSYCRDNFDKHTMVSLSRKEINQLRETIEEWTVEQGAVKDIPF